MWSSILLKVWKQKESLYSCFWGTQNYQVTEPYDDKYVPDTEENFLFKYKMPQTTTWKKYLIYSLTYFCVAVFVFIINFSAC